MENATLQALGAHHVRIADYSSRFASAASPQHERSNKNDYNCRSNEPWKPWSAASEPERQYHREDAAESTYHRMRSLNRGLSSVGEGNEDALLKTRYWRNQQ
jgi:hypothetical protein